MFSVVNTVLLEPLPYKDADRLVRIVAAGGPRQSQRAAPAPDRHVADRAERSGARARKTLSAMAVTITPPITLMPTASGLGAPDRGRCVAEHSSRCWARAPGSAARSTPPTHAAGSNVVVISAGAWQRYFQGDPGILGRTITLKTLGPEAGFLDGTPLTIVGVMPASFDFPLPNIGLLGADHRTARPRERLGGASSRDWRTAYHIDAATDEANAIGEGLRPKPTSGPLVEAAAAG